jgi:manganese transport protein
VPAFGGVLWLGESGVGKLLVASQVVLSFQLPFAVWPLIRLTSDRHIMGAYANGLWVKAAAWGTFLAVTAANVWLLSTFAS